MLKIQLAVSHQNIRLNSWLFIHINFKNTSLTLTVKGYLDYMKKFVNSFISYFILSFSVILLNRFDIPNFSSKSPVFFGGLPKLNSFPELEKDTLGKGRYLDQKIGQVYF